MINNSDYPLFDEAIKYVNKVKNAFRDEKHIPSILRTHGEFQIPKKKYRNSQGKIT
jgi:histone deacetylase complex regulatory component SIN3